ncbi:MAG: tetratricopeptide repeat protein [Gammaproteobacteria bacterium]
MSANNFFRCITMLCIILCSSCAIRPSSTVDQMRSPDFVPLSIHMEAKRYDQALVTIKQLQNKFPDNAAVYVNYAIIFRQQKKHDEARQMLVKALTLSNDNPAANNLLGIMDRESGDFKGALTAYKRALSNHPEYALAHFNIGILYDIYLQDSHLAQKHFQRYQTLTGQTDKQVSGWLADIKRRK